MSSGNKKRQPYQEPMQRQLTEAEWADVKAGFRPDPTVPLPRLEPLEGGSPYDISPSLRKFLLAFRRGLMLQVKGIEEMLGLSNRRKRRKRGEDKAE